MRIGRYAFEFVKASLVFWGLYFLLAAVAFGIFPAGTDGLFIFLGFSILAAGALWLLSWGRLISRLTAPLSALWLVILGGLFFIPLDDNIPSDAAAMNSQISSRNTDRIGYAEQLFFALSDRWTSPIRQYLLEPHKVFLIRQFAYFWDRPGTYADSSIQSQIFRRLLLRSGRFSVDEVRLEFRGCGLSPHTVVAIDTNNRVVHADLWAAEHFERYEFGMYLSAPCVELRGEPYPQG